MKSTKTPQIWTKRYQKIYLPLLSFLLAVTSAPCGEFFFQKMIEHPDIGISSCWQGKYIHVALNSNGNYKFSLNFGPENAKWEDKIRTEKIYLRFRCRTEQEKQKPEYDLREIKKKSSNDFYLPNRKYEPHYQKEERIFIGSAEDGEDALLQTALLNYLKEKLPLLTKKIQKVDQNISAATLISKTGCDIGDHLKDCEYLQVLKSRALILKSRALKDIKLLKQQKELLISQVEQYKKAIEIFENPTINISMAFLFADQVLFLKLFDDSKAYRQGKDSPYESYHPNSYYELMIEDPFSILLEERFRNKEFQS